MSSSQDYGFSLTYITSYGQKRGAKKEQLPYMTEINVEFKLKGFFQ